MRSGEHAQWDAAIAEVRLLADPTRPLTPLGRLTVSMGIAMEQFGRALTKAVRDAEPAMRRFGEAYARALTGR